MINELIHIIPSGLDRTLCGEEESTTTKGTSLGFGCNCQKCLDKARSIIEAKDEKN